MSKKFVLKGIAWGIVLGTVGGYLFNKKTGKANQTKLKSAAKKLSSRLHKELGPVANVTKKHYDAMVGKVIEDLKKDKAMSKEAWDEVSTELKGRWKVINAEAKKVINKKVKKTKKQ